MKNFAAGLFAETDGTVEESNQLTFNVAEDGIHTATRTVNARADDPLAASPQLGAKLSDEFQHMLLTSKSLVELAKGTFAVVLNYTGVPDAEFKHQLHAFDTDTLQPHITTHDDYAADMESFAEKDPGTGQFLFFPAEGGALENHLTGVTSYHDPTMTYTRTVVLANATGALSSASSFFNLGRYFSKSGLEGQITDFDAATAISLPNIPGADGSSRDWFLLRAPIQFLGGAIRITQQFQLSGPFGTNQIIYKSATTSGGDDNGGE